MASRTKGPKRPKLHCAHCGGILRGFASAGDAPWYFCHPNTGLDCYRLVTVYRHGLQCMHCIDVRILEDETRREQIPGITNG